MSSKFTKKNNETKNNEKGDWEYNFLQKKKNNNNNEEENIKVKLCPENVFDPKIIHSYINPQPKKEEILYQKKINGETLNKTEVIILTNYLNKKEQLLNEDISALEKFGLNAKPQTDEGRTRLLLLTLEHQINKNNNDLICNIYLRLCENQFKITPAIEKDFAKSLTIMREIVEKCDLIKIQFEKFSDQMPPLNAKGFQKFDDWQVQVINYIDENKSIVVSAPTSAGKTVLCGYVATKGKTMIVVPTDALAWQLSSYIGKILNKNIPIITKTYQTIPKRDLLVELINISQCIVGTADSIVDFLPLINIKFEWIIFDEIHTIAMPEGSSMEIIAKIYKDIPFLALSATIGNIGELTSWFQSLNINRNVTSIICNKRFFNLQRYYYKTETNKLEILHPLSLVEIENFADGSILNKNIQPTPLDTWVLYQNMCKVFGDLKKLNHKEYFDSKERIELSKADKFFNELIKYLVDNYDKEKITTILDEFKNISYSEETVDLVKLAFLLKAEDKTPTIIFQKNTFACLRMVRQFAKIIEELENKQFPRLYAQRLKEQKKFRRLDKQNDKEKDKSDNSFNSKKEQKQFLDSKNTEETFIPTALQEPTIEFTLNHEQLFAEGIVEEWAFQLKKFYPGISEEYHFIIKLLWRGVGVYAKGLPDTYLRLVQSLATKKQLAIVFSDMSLVFGISIFGLSNTSIAQTQKIGYISFDELIGSMPEAEKASTELQEYQIALQQQGANYYKELNELDSLFAKDSATMNKATKELKRNDMIALYQKVQGWQQTMQQMLEEKKSALLGPIQKKAVENVKLVAKEAGYAYILESGTLLVSPPADDILPLVKKKRGIKDPAQAAKPAAGPAVPKK